MNRTLRTTLITASATVALVAGAAIPAYAAPMPAAIGHRTLAEIQASGVNKTNVRITALNTALTRVNANSYLSASDKSTIVATLNADLDGMHSVAAKLAADTTASQAATDYKSIFTDYRIYAVAIPQARFAAAADGLSARAIPRLTDAHHKLADALAGAYSGKSTPELQAKLADMQSKIDAASGALNGLASSALAVTPSDFNSNHAIMLPIRQSLRTAIADVRAARADAAAIVAAIK